MELKNTGTGYYEIINSVGETLGIVIKEHDQIRQYMGMKWWIRWYSPAKPNQSFSSFRGAKEYITALKED